MNKVHTRQRQTELTPVMPTAFWPARGVHSRPIIDETQAHPLAHRRGTLLFLVPAGPRGAWPWPRAGARHRPSPRLGCTGHAGDRRGCGHTQAPPRTGRTTTLGRPGASVGGPLASPFDQVWPKWPPAQAEIADVGAAPGWLYAAAPGVFRIVAAPRPTWPLCPARTPRGDMPRRICLAGPRAGHRSLRDSAAAKNHHAERG